MMKKFGGFLLAKDANAALIAFFFALLPVFNIPTGLFAGVILGLVTLQKGAKSGLFVLAWIALPTIALLVLRKVGLFDLLLVRCVLVWFFAALLRRTSWSMMLELVAVTGAIVVVVLHALVPHLQQWWMQQLTAYLHKIMAGDHLKLAATPAEFAAKLAPMATGLSAFFFLLSALIELIFARYWQYGLFSPGGFGFEFTRIHVGRIAAIVMCAMIALVFLKTPVVHLSRDIFPLILLPFFMAGLSLIHFGFRQKKSFVYLVVIVYAAIFFLPAVAVGTLALFAFVDAWFDFRKQRVSGNRELEK